MPRPGDIESFKVRIEDSSYSAFCTACSWREFAKGRRRGGSTANDEARRHTKLTGHETRINATNQRGYRLVGSEETPK